MGRSEGSSKPLNLTAPWLVKRRMDTKKRPRVMTRGMQGVSFGGGKLGAKVWGRGHACIVLRFALPSRVPSNTTINHQLTDPSACHPSGRAGPSRMERYSGAQWESGPPATPHSLVPGRILQWSVVGPHTCQDARGMPVIVKMGTRSFFSCGCSVDKRKRHCAVTATHCLFLVNS